MNSIRRIQTGPKLNYSPFLISQEYRDVLHHEVQVRGYMADFIASPQSSQFLGLKVSFILRKYDAVHRKFWASHCPESCSRRWVGPSWGRLVPNVTRFPPVVSREHDHSLFWCGDRGALVLSLDLLVTLVNYCWKLEYFCAWWIFLCVFRYT
jgi:hypothetical protein